MSKEPYVVPAEILAAIRAVQTPEESSRITDQHIHDVFTALNRLPKNVVQIWISVRGELGAEKWPYHGGYMSRDEWLILSVIIVLGTIVAGSLFFGWIM